MYGDDFYFNYMAARVSYMELWLSFPRTRSGAIMHPEYYGGSFVNDDGKLVINVVESAITASNSESLVYIASRESVATQSVQFSYRELLDMLDFIWETM